MNGYTSGTDHQDKFRTRQMPRQHSRQQANRVSQTPHAIARSTNCISASIAASILKTPEPRVGKPRPSSANAGLTVACSLLR